MKRHASLHGLSNDHHTALIVALRCRRAGAGQGDLSPAQAWQQALALREDQLNAHFAVEEELLVPALRELGEAQMGERLLNEHAALLACLSVDTPSADEVANFGQMLDDHIRFEERIVFEQTQDRLPKSVMEAIGAAAPHNASCSLAKSP